MADLERLLSEAQYAAETWRRAEREVAATPATASWAAERAVGQDADFANQHALEAAHAAHEALTDALIAAGGAASEAVIHAALLGHRGLVNVLAECPREAEAAFERAASLLRPSNQIDFATVSAWLGMPLREDWRAELETLRDEVRRTAARMPVCDETVMARSALSVVLGTLDKAKEAA